jgi:SAM-dependent methyltransferase
MENSGHYPESARQWLTTPLGRALLARETRVVEEAFDGIFGEVTLQLGLWGESKTFLRHARTQRSSLIDEAAAESAPSAIGQLHRLPIADDSVDCVLLPHTLDYSDRPHEILREVDRVLTAHGHIIILGFKPGGLWGIRRLIRGAGLPPDADHLVSDRRLKDWLKLLDFRIHGSLRYFFHWPLPGVRGSSSPSWENRGRSWWPEFAACYMLTAQKRVSTLTPVRPLWRRSPQVVAGLAGSTNRVSKIRFDQNS